MSPTAVRLFSTMLGLLFVVSLTPIASLGQSSPQMVVLYDQVDDYDGLFIAFRDTVNTDLDPTTADDFTVPEGATWTIAEVFVDGEYRSNPNPFPGDDPRCVTADIGFWSNGGDRPMDVLHFYEYVAVASDDAGKLSFEIDDTELTAGTYWLSIQCIGDLNISATEARFFYWTRNDDAGSGSIGSVAASINPGGGLGYPAAGWNSLVEINGYDTGLDMSFRLSGTSSTNTALDDAETFSSFSLDAAYPNPFTNTLAITFSTERTETVSVAVYDVLGRTKAVLVDGVLAAGQHHTVLDGSSLPSGLYVVRMTAADGSTDLQNVVLTR